MQYNVGGTQGNKRHAQCSVNRKSLAVLKWVIADNCRDGLKQQSPPVPQCRTKLTRVKMKVWLYLKRRYSKRKKFSHENMGIGQNFGSNVCSAHSGTRSPRQLVQFFVHPCPHPQPWRNSIILEMGASGYKMLLVLAIP